MANVEERIVRMTFDNATFERKMATTLSSLKKLEQALQFKGAHRGFDGINASIKKVKFDPLLNSARELDRSFRLPNAHRGIADLGRTARGVSFNPLFDNARELDRAFQLKGAQQGLADVGKAAHSINIAPIGQAVQAVGSQISGMSIAAIAAFASIGVAAGITAAKLTSAFTFGPIQAGFQEMETNMNSIQTILANTKSKGSNLADVEDALQNLNTYSDKTIYNFSQMAKNIGTFTAAGVGLDESVNAIKGIANLAALSGSNADQASSAMYQLSQALSAGKVGLMDWNSVVNAGMGGEIFKTALFETGKAMGTLAEVPLDQSFTEWEASGNKFRDSLSEEWIDKDVLSTTLEAFSGDLSEVQLRARGFSKESAKMMADLGKQGAEAATSVKTLTQLMGTVKEAIGTGWADTFKIIVGNFSEAKSLFTNMNNFIGGFVEKSAEHRNKMLLDWKDSGGRLLLLIAFKEGIQNLLEVLKPIKEAFRDIFPRTTAKDLIAMTQAFFRFAQALKPSEKTVENTKRIFKGLFAALEIGWTVLKEGVKFIAGLVGALTGLGQGNYLKTFATIGDFFTDLNEKLVAGGGIKDFFEDLGDRARAVADILGRLKDVIFGVFTDFNAAQFETIGGLFDRLKERIKDFFGVFRSIGDAASGVFGPLEKAFDGIMGILDRFIEKFGGFFEKLGQKIADIMGKPDFSKVLDAVNTGLLGGIALLISNFLKKGISATFNFDVGRGLLQKLGQTFDTLTGTLNTLQQNIKADTLMKIAKAIAVLTVSVVVLSLIDSKKLTAALGAMAVGFGQLMASFALINKLAVGPKAAASLNLTAAAMEIMAGAILTLAGAAFILGKMDWGELSRGLTGITVLLTTITTAAILISKYASSFILASVGIVAISGALLLLAGAVALFGQMDWGTMGKGLAGIVGSLVAIGGAMQLMPATLPITAAGLVLVGIALNAIAASMKIFASMEWSELGKGFAAIAAGLVIIAFAMQMMPLTLPLTAAGLVLVGEALLLIGASMKIFGSMEWDEIGRGLAAMAGALLILGVATNAMSGAIVGAVAIGVVAVSLMLLAGVLQTFAAISTDDLKTALIGIAVALTVIGVAAYALGATGATVAILALGGALLVLGAAFALIGGAMYLTAAAMEKFAKVGGDAMDVFTQMLVQFGKNLPMIAKSIVDGVIGLIESLIEGVPALVELLVVIATALIDGLTKLVPKFMAFGQQTILGILSGIRNMAPALISTGFFVLNKFLEGLDSNIETITNSVISIVLGFIDALTERMPEITEAGANLLIAFIRGVTEQVDDIMDAVTDLIITFIEELGKHYGEIVDAGADMLILFMFGIAQNVYRIVGAATLIITEFIRVIGESAMRILFAGVKLILDLLHGVATAIPLIAKAVGDVVVAFIEALRSQGLRILFAGTQMIIDLIKGIGQSAKKIIKAGVDTIISFIEGLGKNALKLAKAAADVIIDFVRGLRKAIDQKGGELREQGRLLAGAIINGMTGGLAGRGAEAVKRAVSALADKIPGWAKKILHINSPSLVFKEIGSGIVEGLALGITPTTELKKRVETVAQRTVDAIKNAVDILGTDTEFNPVVTPVLDLTKIQNDAGKIGKFMENSKMSPVFSLDQARVISSATTKRDTPEDSVAGVSSGGVNFEQNIYAPTRLSTNDIYKQTRNQIVMAKEELRIP